MLWACLRLPDLPLEVFTRAQSQPDAGVCFAVTTGGHQPRIVVANAAARAAGIAAQQLVSAALALAPGIVLRERDQEAERAALAAVAICVTHYTPTVSLAAPEAVLAEIGASLRLFGGLRRLLPQLVHAVAALGYSVVTACAPTPTAARLLARAGECSPVLDEALLARRLAPVPLVHLDADADLLSVLHGAGITTFGAACALPRAGLARRLGAALVDLLDRARGEAPDPQVPFVPPACYRGRLDLPAPIAETEALAFAINRLVHELSGWLLGRGLGVLELSLTLQHERYTGVRTGIPATPVRFALAAPARDATHLMSVLRERLARVALPAPVESLVLTTEATAPLAGRNFGLLPGEEAPAAVPLIDRLRSRLGEEAIVRVQAICDHRPECAWAEQPLGRDAAASPRPARMHPSPAVPAGPRPLWLLREPQRLGSALAAKPWILRDGPERIEAGWWDGSDVRRDYFVVQTPRGERLWIFRDSVPGEDSQWFLHGVFA